MATQFDVIVIGAGPGGEGVTSRLRAQGRSVALVERELIGGECAYWACIPSKTLLRPPEASAAATRAAGLSEPGRSWERIRDYRDAMVRHHDDSEQVAGYEQQGITVLKGEARLVGRAPWRVRVGERELTAGHVVLATGSEALRPPVDGLDALDHTVLWTNREATSLRDIPDRAVLVGGSAVGTELGQFLARMGTRVTIVQRGPGLLDREDPRVGDLLATYLRADGVDVRTACQAVGVGRDGDDVVVELDDGDTVRTDVVVLGAGRRARTAGLGLEGVGVELTSQGAVRVDERCRATEDGLWAIGDVTGIAQFTHVAKYQGRIVADNIDGRVRHTDYTAVPRVVFTQPEVAAVGSTAEQAREAGRSVATAELDLPRALARPWTYETDPVGTLGLVADRDRRVLLGAWAVAPLAGEWIHQAALAIRAAIPLDTLLDGIVQFPTYSEAYLTAMEQLGL